MAQKNFMQISNVILRGGKSIFVLKYLICCGGERKSFLKQKVSLNGSIKWNFYLNSVHGKLDFFMR